MVDRKILHREQSIDPLLDRCLRSAVFMSGCISGLLLITRAVSASGNTIRYMPRSAAAEQHLKIARGNLI
jgi:hypothetical protein